MTGSLQARFSDLLQQHVHTLTIRGQRATGLCPFHPDRHPSFSADLEKGAFYCFGCGLSGGVKKFAELVGEAWTITHGESSAAKAHRLALAAARGEYRQWQREKLITLTDEYRELIAECEVAEIGYRAAYMCPNLYSENDRLHWTHRLTDFYNRLSVLGYQLDLLTFNKWEAEKFAWWQEVGGRI